MKITAVFSSVDSADAALSRLHEAGVRTHRPRTRPLDTPMERMNEDFMLFPSAYESGSMLFPYEMPHLNPAVLRSPLSDAVSPRETVLSAEIPPEDAESARQILLNGHASSVRLS